MTVTPEIIALTEAIEDLRKLIDKQEEQRLSDAVTTFHETERRHRWHETYNAALSGYLSHPDAALDNPSYEPRNLHEWCVAHADQIHGPLEKDE